MIAGLLWHCSHKDWRVRKQPGIHDFQNDFCHPLVIHVSDNIGSTGVTNIAMPSNAMLNPHLSWNWDSSEKCHWNRPKQVPITIHLKIPKCCFNTVVSKNCMGTILMFLIWNGAYKWTSILSMFHAVWPDVVIKSSPNCPKVVPKSSHISFYSKRDIFQKRPKSHQIFGLLL